MISISPELKKRWPPACIGAIWYTAHVEPTHKALWDEIERICEQIVRKITIEDIAALPRIHDTREAYKACGKKPSRYRVSSEALLRRIIQQKGIYQVNSMVDINNLISITSHFSLGTFDAEKLYPPIIFDRGTDGETYEGIGKGVINIEHLPVFRDQQGPFGSPTSDSERAKVTLTSKKFLTVIISFSGVKDLQEVIDVAVDKFQTFAGATNFGISTIL